MPIDALITEFMIAQDVQYDVHWGVCICSRCAGKKQQSCPGIGTAIVMECQGTATQQSRISVEEGYEAPTECKMGQDLASNL